MVAIPIDAQHDLCSRDDGYCVDNSFFIRKLGLEIGSISCQGYHNGDYYLGYQINAQYRNQGLMTAAVSSLSKFLFTRDKSIEAILALVYSWNTPSRRVCEKNGFTIRQIQRETIVYELPRNRKAERLNMDIEVLAKLRRTTDLYSHIVGETRPAEKTYRFSFFWDDGSSVVLPGVGADKDEAVSDAMKRSGFVIAKKMGRRLDYWTETK